MRSDVSPMACVVTVRCARPASRSILSRNLLAVLQQEEDEHHDEEGGGDDLDGRRDRLVAVGEVLPLRDDAHFEIGALLLVRVASATRCSVRSTTAKRAAAAALQEAQLLFDVAARRRVGELLARRR